MTNNYKTWLTYFPYKRPTDSDPLEVISQSNDPKTRVQLLTNKKYDKNLLMIPPGGTAYVYNSSRPDNSVVFQVKNKVFPEGEPNETVIRAGTIHSPLKNKDRSLYFSQIKPLNDLDVVSLRSFPEGYDKPVLEAYDTESEIYFKNGLLRILHNIIPTTFLVPEDFLSGAQLGAPVESRTILSL